MADQTLGYTYDSATNGIGRLATAGDANHALAWSYDTLGRVGGKAQVVAGVTLAVGYSYTNGDMTLLTTPSGQQVAYTYSNHRVSGVAVNGTSVLGSVTYEPFGPARGWTWGNAATETRTYDTNYNPSKFVGLETSAYTLDSAFRITGIANTTNAALSSTYGYDLLDRLTSTTRNSSTLGWTYDANGNRLTQTGATPETLTNTGISNQVSSIAGSLARNYAYDADGNTLSNGPVSFTFNNRGRMSASSASGVTTTYTYDAVGQRILKSGPSGNVVFMYDEQGRLLGEYDGSGNLIQETVWMDDTPVATLRPTAGGGVSVYYVHTDHLNTPRMVINPTTKAAAWRWDSDPFGAAAPNNNPSGAGTFVYNLRFPGQYYDAETGLNYNYFRDYDPATGKYIESDPIGLNGGSNSTYAYVRDMPIGLVDPFGLAPWEYVCVRKSAP